MERIAFIFPDLLPMPATKGGATETLIQHLIDDNESRGEFQFDIYCPYDPDAEKLTANYRHTRFFYIKTPTSMLAWIKFQLFRIKRKLSRSYVPESYLLELLAILKKQHYDRIIVESVFWFIPFIKQAVTAPVYLHLHFDAISTRHPDIERSLNCCDGVICVSRFIEQTLLNFSPNIQTRVLPNVVDIAEFCNIGRCEKATALRQQLGLSEDDRIIIYTGRLMREKGVMELVRAFREAHDVMPELKLVLIGSAGYGETIYDNFYHQLMAEIGNMHNNSIFMTGYIAHEQIPNWFAVSDIAVMPTTEVEEAAGLAALEALAAGCYLVTSDSGAIPEIATCNDSIIVPRGEGFTKRLSNAILHWARCTLKLSPTHGQLHVAANHNANYYYDNFIKTIKSL